MVTDCVFFFFFKDTATTGIYTLSLHDALPIWLDKQLAGAGRPKEWPLARLVMVKPLLAFGLGSPAKIRDRKSTRLNSSHGYISYAVFCLKKKNKHLTYLISSYSNSSTSSYH